jgi:hypothetical protein
MQLLVSSQFSWHRSSLPRRLPRLTWVMRSTKVRSTHPPTLQHSWGSDMRRVQLVSHIYAFLSSPEDFNVNAGELRFRAPQPPQTVAGVLNATTQPDQCFQAGGGTSATNPLEARTVSTISSSTNPLRARSINTISSEDCLFLKSVFQLQPHHLLTKFVV